MQTINQSNQKIFLKRLLLFLIIPPLGKSVPSGDVESFHHLRTIQYVAHLSSVKLIIAIKSTFCNAYVILACVPPQWSPCTGLLVAEKLHIYPDCLRRKSSHFELLFRSASSISHLKNKKIKKTVARFTSENF